MTYINFIINLIKFNFKKGNPTLSQQGNWQRGRPFYSHSNNGARIGASVFRQLGDKLIEIDCFPMRN
jgi:hypothetical protein